MTPVPRQGRFCLIEFLKWYFSKYQQVRTRRVFAQTVTYVVCYLHLSTPQYTAAWHNKVSNDLIDTPNWLTTYVCL